MVTVVAAITVVMVLIGLIALVAVSFLTAGLSVLYNLADHFANF